MKLSRLIARLKDAHNMYGDLDVHTPTSKVGGIDLTACRNGAFATENGVPIRQANEIVLQLRPQDA